MRPAAVEGNKYLSRRFTNWYTIRRSAIAQWLYFLKANYLNYCNIKIYNTWLTSLPKNGSILDQLPYINELESDSSGPTAYPTVSMQRPPIINPLPVKLGSNIMDNELDDAILAA